MISRALLERMKPTAWFVNTARAKLVDNVALAEMLASRRIAGAALDVHDEEPVRGEYVFRDFPNALITPHIGYNTREASANMLRSRSRPSRPSRAASASRRQWAVGPAEAESRKARQALFTRGA